MMNMRDNTGIAYGVSLTIITILILGVSWISISPVIDELKITTDKLHSQDSSIYNTTLIAKVDILYKIWGYFLPITMGIGLIYVIVTAIRKRSEGE